MGLVTEYPFWLILLCLLLAGAYAAFLYFRELRRGWRSWLLITMFGLRFVAVLIISFLLLSPLIRVQKKLVEKPVIVIGVDNSSSVLHSNDTAATRVKLIEAIKNLQERLKPKGDIRIYSFGDGFRNGFSEAFRDQQTDISEFFNEVTTRYSNRNIAAVLVASDGIYNKGTDPFYAARKIQVPVYAMALGDTNLKKDLIIKKVLVNKSVYKGDRFPVNVQLEMNRSGGAKTRLRLFKGSDEAEVREIPINAEQSHQQVVLWIDATRAGLHRYSLRLDSLSGEANLENNRSEFMVEVLEGREQVAIVCNAPHPDIAAITKALEGSSHFEVSIFRIDEVRNNPGKYDLLILHQVPSITNAVDMKPLLALSPNVLFILGSQSDLNTFNILKTGLVINTSKNSFYESEPVLNKDFSLFSVDRETQAVVDEFPPLLAPFGTYQVSPLSDVMVFQQISNVISKSPLILFTRSGQQKFGIIAGENLWRWRLSNYIQKGDFGVFDLTMDKIAMYLATREDKSFFRIHLKSRFAENEPVEMEAEVFNPSYERVTTPDVNITITDSENKSYPFIFSKGTNSYYLKAGQFPVGSYKFQASARLGKDLYQQSGEFYISELNVESASLVADHELLERITSAHDGKTFGINEMDQLADAILARDDIASVSSTQTRITDLVDSYWVFLLIMALLTAEWVLRKREGK